MAKTLANRYVLGELIGAGGMADVYAAEDRRLSRKVAVKLLRSDLARDPQFIARFKKEALSAAGLNHPSIVAVFDSGEEAGSSYIVMELVHGKTLREYLHGGKTLEVEHALEIIAGVLEALDYSHQNGIVHRDIKPGNIMITDHGDVKVMDFGIARALDDVSATMTATWNVVGTAQYLSPEQASGEVADNRSDLYSVGCVLYEMLTGRPPFTGDTPVSIAFQHVSADFLPPSKLNLKLNPQFDHFLSVVMSKDPENRYQDANSMLADLHRIKSGQTITTEIVRPKKRRNRIWQGVAGLLALALIGVGAYSFTAKTTESGIEIPNVVGLSESDATTQLDGFKVVVNHAHDPRIPVDRVGLYVPGGRAVYPSSVLMNVIPAQIAQVPTLYESGYALEVHNWWGLLAPTGTSNEWIGQLHADVNTVLTSPEMSQRLASEGAEVSPISREDFSRMITEDMQRWSQVAQTTGIRAE